MEKVKISVEMQMPDKAPAPTQEDKLKRLQEKIEYAGECIECELSNKKQAIAFLTKLYHKINQKPRHSEQLSRLGERIYAILSPHGIDFTMKDTDHG